MKKLILLGALCTPALALDIPITAEVSGSCVIAVETNGIYGQPNAYTLSTTPADGGRLAISRVDVTLANAYKVEFDAPDSFSSSPVLNDVVTFTSDTEVSAVSDATNMADYETDKTESGNKDSYELTASGSTWFKHSSTAVNGGSRAFASGNYQAVVTATCIAL